MPSRRPSIAREDYLQTILQLAEENVPVIRARLAERLDVSAPSVSEAIRSLEEDGLVEIADRRTIELTADGRGLAENIVRRHRVAERILTDLLGMPWHEAHEEAHRLEHGLSDRVVERALEVLGNPTTCPHGSPIPGTRHVPTRALPLTRMAPGSRLHVERVGEGIEVRSDVLAYLEENGFTPGADGEVAAVSPDGTISVTVAGHTFGIGSALAAQIHVSAE